MSWFFAEDLIGSFDTVRHFTSSQKSSLRSASVVCAGKENLNELLNDAFLYGKVTNIRESQGNCSSFTFRKKRFVCLSELTKDTDTLGISRLSNFEKCGLEQRVRHFRNLLKKHFQISDSSLTLREYSSDILYRNTGILEETWKPSSSTSGFMVEKSKHAGRAEVFRWKGTFECIKSHDIALAYSRAAISGIPGGYPLLGRNLREVPKEGRIRLLDLTIDLPSGFLGLLPVRNDYRGTFYPVDSKIRGVFWEHEVDFAQSKGAKIIEIHKVVGFDEEYTLSSTFEKLIKLSEDYPDFRKSIKFIANIAIGKTAARNCRTKYLVNPKNAENCLLISPKHGLYKRVIDLPYQSKFARPQIFSFITSQTRAFLGELLFNADENEVLSCHTDGIHIASQKEPYSWHSMVRVKDTRWNQEWFAPFNGAFCAEGESGVQAQGPFFGKHLATKEPLVIPTRPRIGGDAHERRIPVLEKPSFRNRHWFEDGTTKPVRIR